MSVTIDYFFNSDEPLDRLARQVHDWLGADLQPYEGDPEDLFCRFLGLEFSLGMNELDNDRELDFESFRYEIGTRTTISEAHLRPMQLIAMSLIAFTLHQRLGITGILVYDLQRLLARYEERHDEHGERVLFDVVSQEPVRFPEHLASLFAKAPDVLGPAPELETLALLEILDKPPGRPGDQVSLEPSGLWKSFVETFASLHDGVHHAWIAERGAYPDLAENQRVNELLRSLSQEQRELLAEMMIDARQGGVHDALVALNDRMARNGGAYMEKGILMEVQPFGTELYYDYVCRKAGDPWPDEEPGEPA